MAAGWLILAAWTLKDTNDIRHAAWLTGTWENQTPKGSIYETWIPVNDREFSGRSYIIKETDTMVFEDIRLVQEADGLYYIPAVKDQNDGLPVRFAAKTVSATQLVFENPQHDFPQTITYTRITADSLVAEISGSVRGRERKQVFPMKRLR